MDPTILGLWVVLVLLVVVIPLLAVWIGRRKRRRQRDEHLAAVTAAAGRLGATVTVEPQVTQPPSATVRPAFWETFHRGMFQRMAAQSRPTYDLALDLTLRGRQVRVTEASMVKAGQSGQNTGSKLVHENRIDVPVAPSPAVKISPVLPELEYRTLGQTMSMPDPAQEAFDDEAATGPDGAAWSEVRLPEEYRQRLRVFAEDPRFATEALDRQVLDWLVQGNGHLRRLIGIEQGVLYAVGKDRIDPGDLPAAVDFVVGVAERLGPRGS